MKHKFYSLSDAAKDPVYYIYLVLIIWMARDQYLSGSPTYSLWTAASSSSLIVSRWLSKTLVSNAKATMEVMEEAKIVMIQDHYTIDRLEKENEDLKEKISELIRVD